MEKQQQLNVRETLQIIINAASTGTQRGSDELAKRLANQLTTQLDASNANKDLAIERLYFLYNMCEYWTHSSEDETLKIMDIVFPLKTINKQASLMNQLISLALSLRNGKVLDACARYLAESDHIQLDESVQLSPSLARESPKLVAAFLSKSNFYTHSSVDRELVARWLNDISKNQDSGIQLVIPHVIRYSLTKSGPSTSDLHLAILLLIKQRKCQKLKTSFLVDIATNLATLGKTQDVEDQVDRFAQILAVALESGIATISNQLKQTLLSKFPGHCLIASLCGAK